MSDRSVTGQVPDEEKQKSREQDTWAGISEISNQSVPVLTDID
jgi:hypothetical protein